MENPEYSTQMLTRVRELGAGLTLDEFGTGYSSLTFLQRFPFDTIKIDRSFAEDINSRASQAVIGSVSVLGHLLGVQIVMEGVETEEQLRSMRGWKVNLVQGYLFSPPKNLDVILAMLQKPQPFPTARLMSAREQIESLAAFLNEGDRPETPRFDNPAEKEAPRRQLRPVRLSR